MTNEDTNNFDPGTFFTDETDSNETQVNEQERAVVNNQQLNTDVKIEEQVKDNQTDAKTDIPEQKKESTDKKPQHDISDSDIEAALKSTDELETKDEQVSESVFDTLIPEPKEPEKSKEQETHSETDANRSKFVPLDTVIKLRQRAQAAEQKLSEMQKAEQERTEKLKLDESPYKKYCRENPDFDPDTDYLPAKIQMEQDEWKESRRLESGDSKIKVEQANREVIEAKAEFENGVKAIKANAIKQEIEFRKSHSDYDTITKNVLRLSPLNQTEQKAVFTSSNPAETIYNICLDKREAILSLSNVSGAENTKKDTPGKKPASGNKGDTPVNEELTDADIANALSDEQSFEAFMSGTGGK